MEGIISKCCSSTAGRVIGSIVVLALVFGAGLAAGREFRGGEGHGREGSFGMMGHGRSGGKEGFFGKGDERENAGLFGVISKIEGNQITITDNAGKPEIIVSLPSTLIVSGNMPVALAALKVGQNIIVNGDTNKTSNQFEAVSIEVVQ